MQPKVGFKPLKLSAFAALWFLLCLIVVDACTCNVRPPVCYEFWRTETVFLGTVKEVARSAAYPFETVEVSVDESFLGISSPTAQTFNYGHSCAHTFAKGTQYLFYGALNKKTAEFGTSLCSRTASVEHSKFDLDFLRSIKQNQSLYWIWGTISEFGFDVPVEGVRAEVVGKAKSLHAISDQEGNLKIEVPGPGTYRVRVRLPKGKVPSGSLRNDQSLWNELRKTVKGGKLQGTNRYIEYEVVVKPNRCGWVDLSLMSYE